MTGRIDLDCAPPLATIAVNNPEKRNCLDREIAGQLEAAAREVERRRDIAVVILRGAGDQAFSAGADFDALTAGGRIAESFAAVEAALARAFAALAAIEIPVIAAIKGACFGGGVQLALAADIRLAAHDSRYRIPAAELGIVYPLEAIEKIVRLAGTGAASHVLLGAEPFDANEAKARRLIDEIVPAAELDTRVAALARKIAGHPRATLIAYKKIIRGFAVGTRRLHLDEIHAAAHASGAMIEKLEAIAKRRQKSG